MNADLIILPHFEILLCFLVFGSSNAGVVTVDVETAKKLLDSGYPLLDVRWNLPFFFNFDFFFCGNYWCGFLAGPLRSSGEGMWRRRKSSIFLICLVLNMVILMFSFDISVSCCFSFFRPTD